MSLRGEKNIVILRHMMSWFKKRFYFQVSWVLWFDRQLNQIFTNGDDLRCLTITLIMEKARADMPHIAVPINGLRIDFQSIFNTGCSFSETKDLLHHLTPKIGVMICYKLYIYCFVTLFLPCECCLQNKNINFYEVNFWV